MGALGGLVIFPLIALYWSCNELARRRKVKRVEKAIEEEIERKKSAAQNNNRRQTAKDVRLDAQIAESLLRRNLVRVNEL